MAYINFVSNVSHINPNRRGQIQVLPFFPTSPNGMTPLQSEQIMGNRAEWWSIDRKTVEVCQHPPGSRCRIEIPCIPEGDDITNPTGDPNQGPLIYGKQYWDEWHSSVKFGQEFEIDAGGIPGITDYWHEPSGPAGQDDQDSFFCILEGGTVRWERNRIVDINSAGGCRYEYTLRFSVLLVRTQDQLDFQEVY